MVTDYIEKLRTKIKDIRQVPCLTEEMVWHHHDHYIWQAEKFEGLPSFYNVYRYKDYYSFSILALIVLKNNMKLNQTAVDTIFAKNFANHPGNYTIDEEIVKIGAPHDCRFDITDIDDYCQLTAEALKKDIKIIEEKNPGKTNIIMCGGKDSMNLLLLPWQNPVVALSAEPNYPLVQEFVNKNKLNIDVMKLEDSKDEVELDYEVVEACCRADLAHWRWGADLRKIAETYQHEAIIWKGQLGDVYYTNDWKNFITPYVEPQRTFRRLYKKFSYLLPFFINKKIGHIFQPIVIRRVWEVCSSLQGGHMSFLRGLMDMLVLSAYHGPNMSALIQKADLGAL
ncbi:MAG TPA: hypothetical protein PK690_01755, partial [Emcibacteraceae bacterium]|nr:hypothetical protein [Emcibacteraceae bacterium]